MFILNRPKLTTTKQKKPSKKNVDSFFSIGNSFRFGSSIVIPVVKLITKIMSIDM